MTDVEALFEACLAQPEGEWAAALERACREHPEHAAELRERFALLGAVGLTKAAADSPMPERLGGFRLLKRLGEGGMGVVYVARQESLGRDVALKIIRPDQLYFAGTRERFRREIDAVARLNHPGIVKVHAAGEEGSIPFLAMELIEGCTLAEALAEVAAAPRRSRDGAAFGDAVRRVTSRKLGREVTLAEGASFRGAWGELCVRIVQEVAVALAHAHGRGVLHRDVKPSNVLVDLAGRVLLLDFGLASAEGSERLTRTGSNLGSLAYMAPEQVHGQALDERADVYALGATLYELLTLQLPFVGADTAELRARIVAGDPVAPSRIASGIPWDVETVCLVALERDPARRYATAAALAADLARLAAHEPIVARRPGALLRARRWVQRRPTLAVALALGFLLVVVGPTVGFFVVRGERDKLETANRRIEVEARTATRTAKFMHDLFLRPNPYDQNDPDLKVRAVLDDAAARLDAELDELPEVKARLLLDVADAYLALSLPESALPLLERSRALAVALHGAESFEVVQVQLSQGIAHLLLGQEDAASAALERAAELAAKLPSVPADWRVQLESNLGNVADRRGDFDAAIEHYLRARDAALSIVPPSEYVPRVRLNLSTALLNAGRVEEAAGELETAKAEVRAVRPEGSLNEVEIESNLGWIELGSGRVDDARRRFDTALAQAEQIVAPSHPVIAALVANLGSICLQRRDWPRAIELFQRQLDGVLARGAGDSKDAQDARFNLLDAAARGGRRDLAEPLARELITALQTKRAPALLVAHAQFLLALGLLHDEARDLDEAATLLAAAEPATRQTPEPWRFLRVGVLLALAQLGRARGEPDATTRWLEQAHALGTKGLPGHELLGGDVALALGVQLHELGEEERAEPLLVEAAQVRLEGLGVEHAETKAAIDALARFFGEIGRDEDAAKWRARLAGTPPR